MIYFICPFSKFVVDETIAFQGCFGVVVVDATVFKYVLCYRQTGLQHPLLCVHVETQISAGSTHSSSAFCNVEWCEQSQNAFNTFAFQAEGYELL